MSGRLARSRQLARSLVIFAILLLSACAQSTSSSPTVILPASAQAAHPTATSGQVPATRILEGKVVGVADGDTVTVLGAGNKQTRVRLQGIDAPESRQAFGQVSKRSLSDLVFDRQVVV